MSQLLSKSVGHGDRVLPSTLVNSRPRSSSVKKTRSLKSRSPEHGEIVPPTPAPKRSVRAQEAQIRPTKDVETGVKFEKFEQQLDHRECGMVGSRENGVVHPSLHSPMMLSTNGRAVSRDSLEDLSSMRNRLVNLRGSGEAGGEDHGGGKNWGYSKNLDQNGNGEMMSNGYGDEGRKGARANAIDHLNRTRSTDSEKLSNGNTRMHEKKESPRVGSRGRHKQQPNTMDYGDAQMIYETPDDVMNTSTNSNPRNGTTHDTAEKPRRTARNRVHHHQESLQQMRGSRGGIGEDRITAMKLVSAGSGNLRVPDSPSGNAKSSSAAIDDLNRIHQRLHQSAEARDSPRGNLVTENGGATPSRGVVVDVREHLEDRLRQRRSNSAQAQSLHASHDVRQDGSRVASHRFSMQSSGDRSPHRHQPTHKNVNYQSSYEREEQTAEREREPLNDRSTQQIISPSKQHSRLQLLASYRSSYEGDEPQTQNSRTGNLVPSEQQRTRGGLVRRGSKPGQTW